MGLFGNGLEDVRKSILEDTEGHKEERGLTF
jgi:hypothetical protein